MATVKFGEDWTIKEKVTETFGPGSNWWHPKCVQLDKSDPANVKLKLRIGQHDTLHPKRWCCAEIHRPAQYGTFTLWVESDISQLPYNVMFGFFLYEDDYHEYDFEASRWTQPVTPYVKDKPIPPVAIDPVTKEPKVDRNAQYAVQPVGPVCGDLYKFPFLKAGGSVHRIIWQPDGVLMQSWEGQPQEPFTEALHSRFYPFSKHHSLCLTCTKVHVNLWVRKRGADEGALDPPCLPPDEKTGGVPYPPMPVEVVLGKYTESPLKLSIKDRRKRMIPKPPWMTIKWWLKTLKLPWKIIRPLPPEARKK